MHFLQELFYRLVVKTIPESRHILAFSFAEGTTA